MSEEPGLRLAEQSPDVGHCWVRYTLRPWPGAAGLWFDLFARGLGQAQGTTTELGPVATEATPDDVLYLPPVGNTLIGARTELAHSLAAAGVPLLVQYVPGEAAAADIQGAVFDALPVVVTGELEPLSSLPSGARVVWPLISGYTDTPEIREEGLRRMADAGVSAVQGVAAELSPAERRHLVEIAGDEGFDRLFHGRLPSEREFAGAVHRHDMSPFLERPLPTRPTSVRGNRRLAGVLAMVGELWLRLERAESRGQAFYRAARWIDHEAYDLAVLAREDNLGIVTWLDAESRAVVEELTRSGRSRLLDELRREYLEQPGQ